MGNQPLETSGQERRGEVRAVGPSIWEKFSHDVAWREISGQSLRPPQSISRFRAIELLRRQLEGADTHSPEPKWTIQNAAVRMSYKIYWRTIKALTRRLGKVLIFPVDLPRYPVVFTRYSTNSLSAVLGFVWPLSGRIIRPDNCLLSGLSGIRPDSEIHYPVHL